MNTRDVMRNWDLPDPDVYPLYNDYWLMGKVHNTS